MVGVVGSSPIVPTKHSRFGGCEKGDPKGSPFLFARRKVGVPVMVSFGVR